MKVLPAVKESRELKDQVIEWRRHLHRNPELSFHEEQTSQFIYETLESFGNLELSRPTKNSVMAKLTGSEKGRVLAIRADIDALPITEENDVDFISQNSGVMHACGHDGHTAMLLGAAKILSQKKDQMKGEIRFIFQHAEEVFPGGAEEMVQAGVMDGVDAVIGTHLWSPLEVGKIGIVYGPMMAAPDTFFLTVTGKGGHAALPHQTIDSIAVASQVVTNLQHIVSRNIDPLGQLVISVTKFAGGTTHNVIPGSVELCGTVRSFDPEIRDQAPLLMERVIKGITEAHGAAYEFKYEKGYRAVINEDNVTRLLQETAEELYGGESVEQMKPTMVGEDFSAFLQQTDGCFFFTGARNEEKGITYPHHHARFTIDEDALERGVAMFVRTAEKMLGKKEEVTV
ncbi:amidohydrolase [Fictibacillus enclensis]|uniref:N-acyl-L-amino acid amidohydrolase n=1 Tax=Fictibacillus enclensis TaxID=1017270 RepID=A0A0V8J5C1_9BACL|nr:M20 family metallopeptidase [Fictibacillus enclensis]KSU81904.1 N-acyl-L-amino acid amidohydrolase [Fictibacillus enclensis]SCC27701.1 amidohydrolase [Fictibacillus enclensis]